MKKYSSIWVRIAVGLTIFLGVWITLTANEKGFKTIIVDDIENISKLSSAIICSEIDNSVTKPIFVGQTMANDLFLKNWLNGESSTGGSLAESTMMQQYLSAYSKKYAYDSVFLISEKSSVYYYQEGINKVVDPADTHDVWYYDFIKSKKTYDLDVDVDEVSGELTVFANCRITADDDSLMGVVGVGIKMSYLQKLFESYEEEYQLRAFLMNEEGLVQVDSIIENIEAVNFFNDPNTLALQDQIINKKPTMQTFWYTKDEGDYCLITQYIENLDWYIVIEKNTVETEKMLTDQIKKDLLFVSGMIIVVLLLISYIIGGYNRMLLKTASLDDVTSLPNAKMFQEIFERNTKRPACRQGTMFMLDVDHFKNVNDHFGHLFGNTVLYRISQIAKEAIGSKGLVARWGGDEFVGVIYGSAQESEEVLGKIIADISQMQEEEWGGTSISLGATAISLTHTLDAMIREADIAMYQSKGKGKNQLTFY